MNQPNHDFAHPGGPPISDRMRDLLARAAQDQMDEQRTHGAAVEELRQRLEGLEWLLQQVREREIAGLSNQLGSVRQRIDDLVTKPPQWAESLAAHIDAVAERAKPIGEMPSVRADLGGVTESVDEILGKLQPIVDRSQQTANRVEDVASRLEKLQVGMDAAGVRFNRIEKVLSELAGHVQQLGRSVEGAVQRIEEDLEGVAHGSENVASRLAGLDGRLEGLHGRLGGVEGRLEAFGDRVEGLPASLQVSEIHRRLADLTQRPIIDPASWLNNLDQRLAQAVGELSEDLRARPDREEVEETLTKIIEAVHTEWARRLAALEETMLALAEALLRPAPRAQSRTEARTEGRAEGRAETRRDKEGS
ncbi:MAG: hypothetical protein GEV03_01175 [Streptosporangiales bacterium]|nr:hypothetical protein [Streptosporangiales bacterium]